VARGVDGERRGPEETPVGEGGAEREAVGGVGHEVVVGEDDEALAGRVDLGEDVGHRALLVGRVDAAGSEGAVAAALGAAAGRDDGGLGEEGAARQHVAAGPRARRVVRRAVAAVDDGPRREGTVAQLLQHRGPDGDALAGDDHVGVRPRLVRERRHVQPAEDDAGAGGAVGVGERVGAGGERGVDRDADHGRDGAPRRGAGREVLVVQADAPAGRRRGGEQRQRERGRERVAHDARAGVAPVAGAEQEDERLVLGHGGSWRRRGRPGAVMPPRGRPRGPDPGERSRAGGERSRTGDGRRRRTRLRRARGEPRCCLSRPAALC
jgi:hypothetical protein